MSSAAVGTHSGAGPLSLMSCVRDSSPLQDFDSDTEKSVTSKRKFWNPIKWFKRKNKASDDVVVVEVTEIGKDVLRSRSTSELSVTEEERRRSSSSMHPAFSSVSDESVFRSPNSGSDMELDAARSTSPISRFQPPLDIRLQTELTELISKRTTPGDTSEDDEGLPHSSCNSPTASDGLRIEKTANKDPTKSHSTCSDGSLHSMSSYEYDDSYDTTYSRHSSKLSLNEKKHSQDSDTDFGPSSTAIPLNHSAAHHRVSVKPKRTHGAPRRRRTQQLSTALPVTPEVNEDSSVRSMSPEVQKKESLIELYSMSLSKTLTETHLKCSSLPPGLTPPGSGDSNKLNRSKSNAGSKSQDIFSKLPEDVNEKTEKLSLLERFFPRKSGRKKKKENKEARGDGQVVVVESFVQEKETVKQEVVTNSVKSYSETSTSIVTKKIDSSRPIPAPRSGAASRQRVLPMDIIDSVEESIILPKPSPEKTLLVESTSPIQVELETMFKQRQINTSPTPVNRNNLLSPTPQAPPRSPKSPSSTRNTKGMLSPNLPSVISSKYDYSQVSRSSTNTKFTETKIKPEDIRSKLKMPGLSSLQQRVLSLNEDDPETSFLSLTDLQNEAKPSRSVWKSHSFKAVKHPTESEVKSTTESFLNAEKKEESKITLNKAASLDSVKNYDDKIHLSEVMIELKRKPQQQVGGSITISGPSHTAVVNVTSNVDDFTSVSKNQTSENVEGSTTISIKEQQVSVTKIQVKRETTQVSQSIIPVPEFLNKQLNKVEIKPASNLILSMKSPRLTEEHTRPKTLFSFDAEPEVTAKPPTPRKFSKENVEIIEKDSPSPKTPTSPSRTKNSDSRKSSLVSDVIFREKTTFRSKSASLDSLNDTDKSSSQDSLDKLEGKYKDETVILRKKSLQNKKTDEEPELMKVFARRSLKIKDSDVETLQESLKEIKTKDSNKENLTDSSVDKTDTTEEKKLTVDVNIKPEETVEVKSPVIDIKTSPVVLRRTLNNNIFLGQRAVTVNPTVKSPDLIIKKQMGFSEHRKTDQWISNMKNEEVELKEKLDEDIMASEGFIMEPKNFSQRKAEWEKRAQLAQKKTSP